jgi:hypothetical protein
MFWSQSARAGTGVAENFTEEKMSQGFFKEAALLSRLLLIPVLIVAQGPMEAQSPIKTPMPPNAGQAPGTLTSPDNFGGGVCRFPETANTWCVLANASTGGLGTMLLLTDGRVMMEQQGSGGCGPAWNILTPASNGDYGNGTWTTTASMANQRLYFGSTVMQNGQVWVVGGEYSDAGNPGTCDDTASNGNGVTGKGEVYDPVANTWSPLTPYPDTASCNGYRGTTGVSCFGDDPSELLPSGTIIAGDIFTPTPQIWTGPPPGTWSAAGTKLYGDRSDEEGWAKLPNGNIVDYALFESVDTSCTTACYAEEYSPTTNTWTGLTPGTGGVTGVLPLLSSSALGYELGPIMRLQDGRIFQIGANQHTALYNPTTNAWAAGPNTIGSISGNGCGTNCAFGADDAPAAELPTGHVIYAADAGPTTGTFSSPTCLFDFNPATNTTSVMSPNAPDLYDCSGPATNSVSAYPTRMLMLPTGQMLFHDGGQTANLIYLYTPTSTAAALPYRPVVQGITGSRPTLTLTGLQLNGQSSGSYYGDDVVTDENYPIVRLVNPAGTLTYYCKTTNWSSVAVGSVGSETVTVTVPSAVPAGSYSLIVTGAGVQGAPVVITLPSGGCGSGGTESCF